jgi:transposase
VLRARIALWARETSNTVIARELRVSVQTICAWRKRIAQQGAQGLREGERSGRRHALQPLMDVPRCHYGTRHRCKN